MIEVFGDFACPWCYILTRRLHAALHFLAPRIRSRLFWRGLPMGPGAAEKALAHPDTRRVLTSMGAAEGIAFALDRIAQVPDTAVAHRLVDRVRESAYENTTVDRLVERIYGALWSEGRDIESPATLAELAAAVGVDAGLLNVWNTSLAHPAEPSADQRRAAALGIESIPFVLVNDRVGVRGTRSRRHLTEAIEGASWFGQRAGERVAT